MRITIQNLTSRVTTGGTDNLLKEDLLQELIDYLKVRVDGYHRTEAYQEGRWDGYKRFMNKKGEFMTGLFPYVYKLAKELGAKITVIDERTDMPVFKKEWDNWVGRIDGVDWKADDSHPKFKRSYQLPAAKAIQKYYRINGELVYWHRGILDCATNAGKNSIVALINNNLKEQYSSIFMVSNTTIYKQAVAFFSQVIEEPVGEVRSGKYAPKWFTVAMVKTLKNKAEKDVNVKVWLGDVKVLYVDESDEAGAKDYSTVLSYIPAPMRVFVSGTPLESKKDNNMAAVGLSGPVMHTITNQDLIGYGVSQNPIVTILWNNQIMPRDASYEDEKQIGIYESIERCKVIQGVLEQHDDKQILVSFTSIEHGYFMYNYLNAALPHVGMGIIHGSSPDREDQIQNYNKKRISVLFSSMILKRGANIPSIEVLVIGQGGKSITTIKQYTGRGLRHDGINDNMLLYDIYDNGSYLSDHSRNRIRIYKNEGFDVTLNYRNKRGIPYE